MRVLLQRVKHASVHVDGEAIGSIGHGLLLLVGIGQTDQGEDARYLADKIVNLRIFDDEAGRMNQSLLEVAGQILSVSQFTLFANLRKGRRPSYTAAAEPQDAERLFEQFNVILREHHLEVQTGKFGAMMDVQLVNDGPVTLWLDSEKLRA